MNKNTLILISIVVLVVAGVLGFGVWLNSISPTKVLPNENIKGEQILVRPSSNMTGNINAKVTLVEFADFQCPACAGSFPLIKQIVDKYKSNPDFNFVGRNFPLPQHANAYPSAQAAEAAATQGKYLEMSELLYRYQNDWSGSINPTGTFVGYARELGLNVDQFEAEIKASKYLDRITQDLRDAEMFGVNSTPTFFLNGQKLTGYSDLDSQINSLLY